MKHLANGASGDTASRITRGRAKTGAGLSYLRVYGLRQSKASSNPDGGLKDLLSFMERKASAFTTGRQRRNIMIKKVCNCIDHVSGRIEVQQRLPDGCLSSQALGARYDFLSTLQTASIK